MSIIPLLGAPIFPGDFIITCTADGVGAACQVKHCISTVLLEVVQWVEPVDAPLLCPQQYDNVLQSKVKELVARTMTTINAQDVVDMAFVFTPELLQHVWTDVSGMKQVYFTRLLDNIPFSPITVESFPCHLWFALLTVKDIVRRILSSKRQYHLCKRSISTVFSLEAWW
jgi:hypothetical protein